MSTFQSAAMPQELPTSDDARAQRILDLAKFLDDSITIPGTNYRIGWDALIGLVPIVGDFATMGISTYLVWEAVQLGGSKWLLTRMLANVGVDAVVGLIPIAGDVFDAAYKCNKRNAILLSKHLEKQKQQSSNKEIT